MTRPLDGVTVVTVEQAVAVPFASRQLADLGARVIKIERPGAGDFARDYDHVVKGMSSHFVWLNRSKESVALDLKTEGGREALRRLVARSDVFLQNLAPGAVERLGFGARELRARQPGLIHCSVSGYGPGGPYSDQKAYDLIVQCEAGLVSMTGTPAQQAKAGIAVADIAAGMYAYTAVLSALLRRSRAGEGATIEITMLEALMEWMGFPMYYAMHAGEQPPRSGVSHPVIAPYGPFTCRDGVPVFVGIQNQREWGVFCRQVIVRPELEDSPLFATNIARVSNTGALTAAIEEVFGTVDSAEMSRRLTGAGIVTGRLRDVASAAGHPQLAARDRWREVGSPVGPLPALLPPALLDGDEPEFGPIPAPGEHTAQVLRELGLEEDAP
jgi:itaconate CoA-transferase